MDNHSNERKIKGPGEKIVSLSSNACDGSQIKSPIGTKVNDTSKLKKELHSWLHSFMSHVITCITKFDKTIHFVLSTWS